MKKERPIELWIIIIFITIYVINQLVLARYYYIHPNTIYKTAVYECTIAAIVGIILIYSLFKGFLLAWYITVIVFCIMLDISIYFFIYYPPNIFTALLIFAGLFLLFRRNLRNYFKKEKNNPKV